MKITARINTGRRNHDHDELVIDLPDLKLLRLIARSVLLAAAILSLPWLRLAFRSSGPAGAAAAERKWIDDPFSLPMLIRDLKRQGLFAPGATALLLGDPSSRLPFLKKNGIDPVLPAEAGAAAAVEDWSVDFCLAADGLTDSTFGFVDRVLKVGGVAAVRLGTDPAGFFRLPRNYRVAYIRRFGSTVVAIKKTSHATAGGGRRRLLSVALALLDLPEEKRFKKSSRRVSVDVEGGGVL
ncbi:uncharacterized protein M6B38_150355 [Iris pallida]|uniref:Methyltransferase type 11 domain-containing protein n=1 Tax=Iris pallida TaxID=29817 RepID=A0AAX6F5L7_IRIPA|nr:uncharacterized protein M6B38_150355 [Iris pallida]